MLINLLNLLSTLNQLIIQKVLKILNIHLLIVRDEDAFLFLHHVLLLLLLIHRLFAQLNRLLQICLFFALSNGFSQAPGIALYK